MRTVNIPIQRRQKPEIPHTPEDTEIFRKAIKAVNDSANRAETAANTSEQNAKKTAEDRKTIEEMVETVSGIEQQVQDVKKYAGQAETAASNAALSEQKAKESETAALQAKADAETAKGSAETAAGKTAEDRTAVERAKEEVLQAKQQVSTDRAAVEAVERNVAQMGNAIPQAVLEGIQAVENAGAAEKQGIVQAGTEQKSAVESAGTKAVEDITLAKKSATDAVETAKTGAVGAVETAGTEQTQNVTAEGEKQVKAVADKGNEVLQSIPEDFVTQMESKLDKQQGAENAGKAMVINPEGVIVPGEVTGGDGIPIINTASGESPLVISDSAERVNKGFSIIGNTEQLTTTGANLFDISKISSVNVAVGKDVIIVKEYASNAIITAEQFMEMTGLKPGDSFTISYAFEGTITGSTGGTAFLGSSKSINFMGGGQTGSLKNTVVLPSDFGSEYGTLYFYGNKEGENCYIKNFMINKGNTAKPYEPYTGGKPSPSPDYPQEIKNVGKWNEEKRKYEVDVRVTGKNLFNIKSNRMQIYNCTIQEDGSVKSNINNHYYSYINITDPKILENIKNGQTITFSIDKGIPKKALSITVNDGKRVLEKSSSAGERFVTLAVSGIGKVKSLELRFNRSSTRFTGEAIVKDLMLCYGESTQYQPYSEQTLTLTSDRPITKWDRLVEQGGQIGWLYKSKIDALPKTGYRYIETGYFSKGNVFTDSALNSTVALGSQFFTCFSLANPSSKKGDIAWLYVNKPGTTDLRVRFADESINTIELFEKYMADKDMKILYETAQTEFVPLPQSEQNAIRALKTYYPTTVITVDGGEVIPSVELTYTADTKNYIDQKIAAIGKTVVDTQKALL